MIPLDNSAFDRCAQHVINTYGRREALRLLTSEFEELTNVERAAFVERWATWGRSKQLAPDTEWRRWGFLTGRGFGKTVAVSKHINNEVQSGRASLLCLVAQDEASAVDIQVKGPSGLIATAPLWCKPQWEASSLQLVWPNGARAYVRTPEVPGKIRGLEYQLTWASELQSWPASTREEAWSNVLLSTRLGYARVIWDATPKRRHPILRELLSEGKEHPRSYPVVRGTTQENEANLGIGFVQELERKYEGTARGREELGGEMLDEMENATATQEWIDRARRHRPDVFARRAIGLDPAVSTNKGSDNSGIVLAGLGADDQAYVLANYSGKHSPHAWAKIVLDAYVEECCDVVLVETNRGGDLVVQNLRAAAHGRGLQIVELGRKEKPRRTPGVVNVKSLYSQGSKQERAQPVSTSYERGRVSHVIGADLTTLEDTLTTWEPGSAGAQRGTRFSKDAGNKSPDDLDALTFVVVELLDLAEEKLDGRKSLLGIQQAQKVLSRPAPQSLDIARLLGGGSSGKI